MPLKKTPDEQEATYHIERLQKRVDENHIDPLCSMHTEALIWIIRRLDLSRTYTFLRTLAYIIALIIAAYVTKIL